MRIRRTVAVTALAAALTAALVTGPPETAAASAFAEVPSSASAFAEVPSSAPAASGTGTALAEPRPVYGGNFPDPAVARSGSQYVAVATGALGPLLTAPTARGPWTYRHAALTRLPTWSSGGGIWAPEIQHVRGDTWVMFYAAKVTGLVDGNQRCIGVAVSTGGAAGRYTPVDRRPLVCPPGSDHPGASAPVTGGVGFIDPSVFTARDGRHVLLFKSQKPNPGTKLWSLELNADWTAPVGSSDVLLSRARGQIENPHMVVRDGAYYLFASWNNWADCSYRTVWLKNAWPRAGWSYPDGFPGTTTSRGGTLIASRDGLCGPGGLVTTWQDGNVDFFLHAYRDADRDGVRDSSVRRLYAGRLGWTSAGVPRIASFFSPS
ncbi:family 43 glycosylhydrolase [Streptomyces sp. DH24]|uniref:family 43 glycosylhydrolase n=1 Tax=Streptomyces sp. DH24 TaxID=3040123 RepID=UPI0024414BDE|nr:family 43 glycosylhydrolase [Streptomyces sp. DH24]MDG9719109.1 family 43 glycosylhydrolase [Streptomyces sp. DH24]